MNEKSAKHLSGEELNKQLEGDDKAPGEEEGRGEKVTNNDLKGKKVDTDLSKTDDQPQRGN